MKSIIYFLTCFLIINSNLTAQSYCETYQNVDYDYVFHGGNASELDPNKFVGNHILFKGYLFLDTDFIIKDCTIELESGQERIAYDVILDGQNYTPEIIMENVTVYTCQDGFTNFIAPESLAGNTNGLPPDFVKVTLKNCVFDGFYELMHVHGGQYDVRGCTFIGRLENQISHGFHIIDYGTLPNYNYRPIHFSDNKFYNTRNVFEAIGSNGIVIGDKNYMRNEFYNCGIPFFQFSLSGGIFSGSSYMGERPYMVLENNYFSECGKIGGANAFLHNEFVNVQTAITSTIYAKNNIFTNSYKQNSAFLNENSGNQFMINNTINQQAPIIITKKPNAGYIKSGDGSLFIEGGIFNGSNQTRYADVSTATLDISNETVDGGSLITRGVADYDIYDTDINKNGGFSGFNMNMSNGIICNSSSKNATRAFSFQGNCMNTNLTENEIGAADIGLYIDNIIGPQKHKGNTWEGNYSSQGATNTSSFPLASRFVVNPNPDEGGNSLFIPQNGNYSPSTFFNPDETTSEIDECIYEFEPNGFSITDIDLLIINNTFNIDPLSNWLAIRNLIQHCSMMQT